MLKTVKGVNYLLRKSLKHLRCYICYRDDRCHHRRYNNALIYLYWRRPSIEPASCWRQSLLDQSNMRTHSPTQWKKLNSKNSNKWLLRCASGSINCRIRKEKITVVIALTSKSDILSYSHPFLHAGSVGLPVVVLKDVLEASRSTISDYHYSVVRVATSQIGSISL